MDAAPLRCRPGNLLERHPTRRWFSIAAAQSVNKSPDIAIVVTGTFFGEQGSGSAGDDHHLIHATFRLGKLASGM
jgi:hypothetical protein